MKKILLTLAVIAISEFSYAQNSPWSTSGNIGIGTTGPTSASTYKLEIYGSDPLLGLSGSINGTGTVVGLEFNQLTTATATRSGGAIKSIASGSYIGGNGFTYNSDLAFYSIAIGSNIEQMRIMSNGNVGIGTTSPGQKLEVAGNLLVTGTNGLILNTAGGGAIDNQTGNLFLQKANGAGFIFRNSSPSYTEYMRIDASGNVGIGTNTPDAKLAVNGTIHTKEVKVDLTGWPDYVFKPKYKLLSLTDVKNYINKNQHLPEMPSEAEVAKNGINLGEIVKIQTKKIEELTLYLIDKDKQLSDQQKKSDQQDARIALLEKTLEKLAGK